MHVCFLSHTVVDFACCAMVSRVLNFWWLWKIVKIVLKGGHKKHIDENQIDAAEEDKRAADARKKE